MLSPAAKGAQLVSRTHPAALQRAAARRQPARRMRCQPVKASSGVECCEVLNAVLLSYILIQQNRQQTVQAKMAAAVTKLHQAKLQQATQTCTDSDNNAA